MNRDFSPKNILVTGGAGFIGSNFIHLILKVDPTVQIINLDALTYAGSLDNLKGLVDPSRHHFIEGDITDQELVRRTIRDHRIDTIVHFAAESHVDRSILGPGQFVQTNIVGTYNLIEEARQAWLVDKVLADRPVHFHHVSTDEVFGTLEPDEPAWTEEIAYEPNSPLL